MPRNPRYDPLFEPVRIGPKVAPNRFYQTPHATGMGYLKPRSGEALRAVKAEGGWGVVCTDYCSIHPTSDDSPYAFLSLWDEEDVRALARTAEAIQAHGSLAGIELWHGGLHANNRLTREPPIAPSGSPVHYSQPGHARALDKSDIKALRGWQVTAAKRAREAGFDVVYVYAGHDYLPFQFLSPHSNRRGDEYGGSLTNRVRLLREMIEDTKEAVGHDCAVAVRLGVDELLGPSGITAEGEGREILAMLAELPDLWDVNLAGGLGNDSTSARFAAEGFQERYVAFVKQVTTKPVVSVGRFTSPDAMLDQVKRGILDFVGAARPSIADPFLPRKIDEGREDEIRECIGCNICRAANNEGVPLRCTQNPTIGEEWRRGWHPERIQPAPKPERVLIVGGGPAGLECARALGERGYEVSLAEKRRELGGRLLAESRLPGLGTWIRVRDWRLGQIRKRNNVALYPESAMTARDVLDFGAERVVVATGARWRRDAVGAQGHHALSLPGEPTIVTPDDLYAGTAVSGPVVIYDDDHYYTGGALAERLVAEGHRVVLATPAAVVSAWTAMTDEQAFVQRRLVQLGVELVLSHQLSGAGDGVARLACTYGGGERRLDYGTLLLVTGREPKESLYRALLADPQVLQDAGVRKVVAVGDCRQPSSVADAVYAGHKAARFLELEEEPAPRRERPAAE